MLREASPPVGSIFLDAYQDGNNVVIEVRDDGNGIDVQAVKNKAIERGVITPDQGDNMTEKDIINLLFHAGFSTAKEISDVSGRGVGLDVVKSKIESLSGEVEVKSVRTGKHLDHQTASYPCNYSGPYGSCGRRKICDSFRKHPDT